MGSAKELEHKTNNVQNGRLQDRPQQRKALCTFDFIECLELSNLPEAKKGKTYMMMR